MIKQPDPHNIYELSNLPKNQLWFWIGQNLQPDSPLFNMPMAITIKGKVEHKRFNLAFKAVLARSDALRTVVIPEKGIPRRQVIENFPYDVELVDLSEQTDPDSAFSTWACLRCRQVFDMKQRMFDSVLVKLAEDRYLWYWCQHHLICDGWSTALVYRHVAEFYQASYTGELDDMPCFPQYEEYTERERAYRHSEEHEKARLYWEKALEEPLESLSLYGKTAREHGTTEIIRVTRDLGEIRTQGLKRLAKEKPFKAFSEHLSVFQLISTCLFSYLYRITGNESLGMGSLYHNRQSQKDKQTIGFFMEMAPIRVNVAATDSFEGLFLKIRKQSNEVLRNYRFAPGNPMHKRSFDIALNYNNASYPDFAGMPISLRWLHTGTWYPHEPLAIQIHDFDETGTFTIAFDFNCGVFDEALRERVIQHFNHCIDALIENPEQLISEFEIITTEEKKQIFEVFKQASTSELSKLGLHHLFEAQVEKTPTAIAVYNQEQSLTYQALDQEANQLAHYLIEQGVLPNSTVGICIHKTPRMLVAMLAVLKAGAGYVPLDPDYPAERLSYMIDDSKLTLVLTHSEQVDRLPAGDLQKVKLDSDWPVINQHQSSSPGVQSSPDHLAYVIYTSGSTGNAKGVMIEHHSIVNYVLSCQETFKLSSSDCVLQFASISFDAAAEEIYPALLIGARICLVEEEMRASMTNFVDACEQNKITFLDLPTAFWHQLCEFLTEKSMPLPSSIHTLVIGGERAQPKIVNKWLESVNSQAKLLNTYGPTEATVVATYCQVEKSNFSESCEVPIGRPVNNLYAYVLDKNRQAVPIGVVGELYIGGEGVARGYLGKPELTDEKFILDPFNSKITTRIYRSGDLVCFREDGLLEYRDRADDQVKIRGFRIELGEVESALMRIDGIYQGVVVVGLGPAGDKRLAAYYKVAMGHDVTSTQLRNTLRKNLPDYMVPQHFIELDSLPLNANGKVNKKKLPPFLSASDDGDDDFVAPDTREEMELAKLWQETLKVGKVGKYDNFFDVGGDSLLMMQVIAGQEIELGFQATPRMLVSQNLSQLAAAYAQGNSSTTESRQTDSWVARLSRLFSRKKSVKVESEIANE